MSFRHLQRCLPAAALAALLTAGCGGDSSVDESARHDPGAEQPESCEISVPVPLAADGTFSLPDYAAGLEAGTWLEQEPAPGVVYDGPQSVAVTLRYRSGDGDHGTCSLELILVDETAPSISVVGLGDDEVLAAGTVLEPTVEVVDGIDPAPTVELTLNGQPYTAGQAITEAGLYALAVTTTDDSGNVAFAKHSFEIADEPRHEAVVLPTEIYCAEQEGGTELYVQLLVATSEFDPRQINLDTVALFGYDEAGQLLSDKPIPIAGSIDLDTGAYSAEWIEAFMEDGYWTLGFWAGVDDEALRACPTSIDITGGGLRATTGSFDFTGSAALSVVANPVDLLADMGLLLAGLTTAPAEAPAAKCKLKYKKSKKPSEDPAGGDVASEPLAYELWLANQMLHFHSPFFGGPLNAVQLESWEERNVRALPSQFEVMVDSTLAKYGWGSETSVGNAMGQEEILVWVEPSSCPCTTQRLEADLRPEFKLKMAAANGHGGVSGRIDVLATCEDDSSTHTRAYDGVAAGTESATNLTIGTSPTLSVPAHRADQDAKFVWAERKKLACKGNGNDSIRFAVDSGAHQKLVADPPGTGSLNIYLGKVKAEAYGSSRGIEVDGYCDGQRLGGYFFR